MGVPFRLTDVGSPGLMGSFIKIPLTLGRFNKSSWQKVALESGSKWPPLPEGNDVNENIRQSEQPTILFVSPTNERRPKTQKERKES